MKTFKMNPRIFALVALVGIAVVTVSCNKEEDATPYGTTEKETLKNGNGAPAPGDTPIAQIAIDAGFSELVGALSYVDQELNTGLVDLFMNGTDQYTVFAPTNDAFFALYGALGITGISDLPAELVRDVLFYHVTEGRRAANSVVPKNNTRTIETLLGETFSVNPQAMITAIGNTANITTPNISASNGIIHIIDAVILPIE
jgi:transforming growth factor-beta-induced protein